jgi:hypothetical protein
MQNIFEHNGATVIVRSETIRDRLTIDAIVYRLGESDDITERYMKRQFAEFIQLTEADDFIGVALPGAGASAEVLQAAYEQWLDLDAEFYEQWRAARAGEKKLA